MKFTTETQRHREKLKQGKAEDCGGILQYGHRGYGAHRVAGSAIEISIQQVRKNSPRKQDSFLTHGESRMNEEFGPVDCSGGSPQRSVFSATSVSEPRENATAAGFAAACFLRFSLCLSVSVVNSLS
jgi:hypothetical protein